MKGSAVSSGGQSRVMSKREKTERYADFWAMAYSEAVRAHGDSAKAAFDATAALNEFKKQVFAK